MTKLQTLILIWLIPVSLVLGQPLRQTGNGQNQTVGAIISKMEESYGLRFSYDPETIPLQQEVAVKVDSQSIEEILIQLSQQTGIRYKLLKNHVALYFEASSADISKVHPVNDKETSLGSNNLDLSNDVKNERGQLSNKLLKDSNISTPLSNIPPSDAELVEKEIAITVSKPEKFNLKNTGHGTKLFVSPVVSLDFYRLSSRDEENKDFSYASGINYGIGISAGRYFFEKAFLNIQLLYNSKNYSLDYNLHTEDPKDPYLPKETEYKLIYLDVPLEAGINLFRWNNWNFVSFAGATYSQLLNKKDGTVSFAGTNIDTPAFMAGTIKDHLISFEGGLKAETPLSDHFSLSIACIYRKYLSGINENAAKIKLNALQFTSGLQYHF